MFRVAGVELSSAEVAILILLSHREDAISLFDTMVGIEQRDHRKVKAWLNSLHTKNILQPYPDHFGVDHWCDLKHILTAFEA